MLFSRCGLRVRVHADIPDSKTIKITIYTSIT